MQIFIASDHAGFELKNTLVAFLREKGMDVEDMGPSIYIESDDYPDTITPVAKKVAQHEGSFGIVLGGSGQGEAMAANRVPGARAAVYYGGAMEIVQRTREHNDANILSMGARFVTSDEACAAVELFLETPFSAEERHMRRIQKLG